MRQIVRVIMDRDSLSEAEAEAQVNEVQDMIRHEDNLESIEDMMMYELGLESDLLLDLLY